MKHPSTKTSRRLRIGLAVSALSAATLLLAGCQCSHEWSEPTCTKPAICAVCNEIQGEPTGHIWQEATCEQPRSCADCGATEGAPLGHDWLEASCTVPRTCARCEQTTGEMLEHDWIEASCTAPRTCSVCAKTEGDKLEHDYIRQILVRATCAREGRERLTCSRCVQSYEQTYAVRRYTAEELYALVESAVGELTVYNKRGDKAGLGTAFVYAEDGTIVTNYHVIERAYLATFALGEEEYEVKRVLGYDKDRDIAVLKIEATGLPTLPVCSENIATGAQVYALGSSRGMTATFSSGIITTAAREFDGVTYVQHDAAISAGNSGGPLLNSYGEVIAINTMYVKDAQNLNFSVFISELDKVKLSKGITLAQFYATENDPIARLKEMAMDFGELSGDTYTLVVSMQFSSNMTQVATGALAYTMEDDMLIYTVILMDVNDPLSFDAFAIELSEISEEYVWFYGDMTETFLVGGMIEAAAITPDDTALKLSGGEGVTSSEATRISRLCAELFHLHFGERFNEAMLEYMGFGIEALGFTAY